VRACVGAFIGAGMVWGGWDAWRTGGRRFAGVWQRHRLAGGQAPHLGWRVQAFLLVRARVRTVPCMHSSASFSLADIPLAHHQNSTTTKLVIAPSSTAMLSQAMVHPFPRPPSLRVVSCPVARLASVSSRRAATGIHSSIHPGQQLLKADIGAAPRSEKKGRKGGK
jgi:hypothetical protein